MNDAIFKSVLENFPIGIILLNEKDEIVFVNEKAENIRHVKSEKIVGRNVLECHSQRVHDNVHRALNILKSSKEASFKRVVKDYRNIAKIIRHHHEKYDGSGYPDGLKTDTIPEESRIIAISDCYDAMTSDRPYRDAMEPEEAIIKMKALLDNQLDPFFGKMFFDLFYTGSIN